MTFAIPIPKHWPPSWRASSSLRWGVFAILGMIVCIASALVIFPETGKIDFKSDSFSADEPGWIAASYYYTELLREGNFDWKKWDCPQCGSGSSYGSLNMHLGEWLIGVPLALDPHTKSRPFLGYYDVDATLEENIREGQVPPPDILARARTAPAIFGVLCCLLVFAIGFWTYNAWIGLIAACLLLMNPVFLKLSGQVMTDTFYNFFLLSCCLALIALYKTSNAKRALLLVSLTGILTGLACSVKVTGLVAGGALFVLAAGWRFYVRKAGKREIFAVLALFSICTLTTVYAINPLFWPSSQEMSGKAIVQELRSLSGEVAASKRIPWKGRDAFVADNRYPQLKNLSHVLEFPLLFPRWQNMMQRQSSRGWEGWQGPRLLSLHKTLLGLSVPAIVRENRLLNFLASAAILLFAGTGIVFLVRKRRPIVSSARDDSHLVPLMHLLATYLLIALFMKLNWDRYYLPTIIAGQIITAVGIYAAVERGYHSLAARRRS